MAKPVATITDHSLHTNVWAQPKNWLSYSDADGNAATQYQFWDSGTESNSGYFWTPDNPHNAADTPITVNAADLASVWLRSGQLPGTETLWVRAFDGTEWSNWDAFNLTSTNNRPVATVGDHSVHVNVWAQAKNWLVYSDADGDAATQYQFYDGQSAASSGYIWTPDNAHNAAGTNITVNAADLASVWIRGGAVGGSEPMWVRAFDGSEWGDWDVFTFTTIPNNPPVAAISDHSLHINEWVQPKNWLTYTDADGNAATQYQFYDGQSAANSGYFWTPDNSHNSAGTNITVNAADLFGVWLRGGAAVGSEPMWVRASDGNDWGPWDQFTLTTII